MDKLVECFPTWKPRFCTKKIFESNNRKECYKAFRNSSSGFVKRPKVRDYILKRDGYGCKICGSKTNLQIDHIKSVYIVSMLFFWREIKDYNYLNCEENLQTLCGKCNAAKQPNEVRNGKEILLAETK